MAMFSDCGLNIAIFYFCCCLLMLLKRVLEMAVFSDCGISWIRQYLCFAVVISFYYTGALKGPCSIIVAFSEYGNILFCYCHFMLLNRGLGMAVFSDWSLFWVWQYFIFVLAISCY